MSAEETLNAAGHVLPPAAAPAANYVPFTVENNIVYVSGQLPLKDGALVATGRVGEDVDAQLATAAAEACALNVIAQVKAAAGGDLSRVKQVLKLGVF
ncbi:MAG: RidA family protein, partial [Pseudomonadota bacterium]